MPWPIRYHDTRPARPQVGDCWPDPSRLLSRTDPFPIGLSEHYLRDWYLKRPPLRVLLPNGAHFCLDNQYVNRNGWYGKGWRVTGEPPAITVHPSIHWNGTRLRD